MYIQRLNNIQDIINLKNEYYDKYHILPLNVSNWTVSDQFRNTIENTICIDTQPSRIDYIYSYSIPETIHNKVIKKIGVPQRCLDKVSSIFFPNNTIAIVNVCVYLKKINAKNVGILNPAYFSIAKCLETFDIQYHLYNITRENDQYDICNGLLNNNIDVLWITSPIFSTGCYYTESNLNIIKKLLDKGVLVIADESFSIAGNELIRKFADYHNFIGIYSPHKSLSINALKFSVVICNSNLEDFFEQWLDLYCGNLQQSTIAAIYHYLSDNFSICSQKINEYISNSKKETFNVIQKYNCISYDIDTKGSMITVYLKNKDLDKMQCLDYIREVIENTLALYYPGSLNGFNPDMGFCFRINCALYDADYIGTLNRLLNYICVH